ncbi:hypothetical protein ILUMI_10566 [Ignelater luminosus]|uniref:Uncharacterized protein n=1 Tax=Ignelater luminosus TaxID=2038154 RepID=A0A8K0CXN7_IGNLU|nr:hypothetical protein ILUMI_10566 [Ignelater luminosus]
MKEFLTALGRVKLRKSPGHGGVTPEMLKYMGQSDQKALLANFQLAYKPKRIQDDCGQRIIILLFKKSDDRNCGNYRAPVEVPKAAFKALLFISGGLTQEKRQAGQSMRLLLLCLQALRLMRLLVSSDRTKRMKKYFKTELWIEDECPKNIQEERKKLIPQLKDARNKRYRAYLKYNKSIMNKEAFNVKGSPTEDNLNKQLTKITKTIYQKTRQEETKENRPGGEKGTD